MTVLVTGGAGFVGSHLIERMLAAGGQQRIVCLDNFNDYYDPALKRANAALFSADPRVAVVDGSFVDAEAMQRLFVEQRVSHVMHLGAYAGVRASVLDPLLYETVNVRGTLALLEAARHHAVERFVLVSSSTVYGQGAVAPFREDAELGTPLSPYGATKRAAELLGMTYYRLHQVPVVCVRPFSVYGPRIRPDLALHVFASAILRGQPVPLLGDGSVERDFTHVSDVCAGLLSALTADNVAGEAINLGHHAPVSMSQLLAMLESELGRTAKIERREPFAGDMPLTCADLSKAQRLLGYQARVSLADGLRDFARWIRQSLVS